MSPTSLPGISPSLYILLNLQRWVRASALRIEDKLGTVEKGKLVDIVVVNGDPLEDIRILQKKRLL